METPKRHSEEITLREWENFGLSMVTQGVRKSDSDLLDKGHKLLSGIVALRVLKVAADQHPESMDKMAHSLSITRNGMSHRLSYYGLERKDLVELPLDELIRKSNLSKLLPEESHQHAHATGSDMDAIGWL